MNYKEQIITESNLKKLVQDLIKDLKNCKIILLSGKLGVGKTSFVKEFAKQLGEKKIVTSPTFQIMNVYDKFVHIDAYNLDGSIEQYYDYFEDKIIIIEWPEKIKYNFKNFMLINISYTNNLDERLYEIKKEEK